MASWPRRLPRPLAIAFDLIDGDEAYASAIRGAQVRAIVSLTPIALGASCINAAIFLATWASVARVPLVLWLWALLIFALAADFLRGWLRGRKFTADRGASRRALKRMVANASLFGIAWGFVPAAMFAHAPVQLQLFIGCLSAGMMCAGGFVLATVPLAAIVYVALVAAGAAVALVQVTGAAYVGLAALLVSYTAVLIVSINWSATLFVSSRLAEAQVRTEVAARELAQEKAAHAERLAALGQLAGGIAHDFNNILQAVSGSASLIERHLDEPERVRRLDRRILEAVERGDAISRRLLAFARRDVLRADTIDAGELLRELAELLAHTLGSAIEVRLDIAEPALRLHADRRQLETVLVNLAANARDAMPNGGTLVISAAAELVGDGAPLALKPGRYGRISLSDHGVGMDAATLARAMEPFFSTKPRTKGTGLGLSMAKGFAEQSGGALSIVSKPGQGATVTLWLPQAEAPAPTAPEAPSPTALGESRSGGRVLVVDDDELVRELLVSGLQDAGFEASGAENGEQALSRLDQGEAFDAVVTDLSMPGMSGWDLIRALRARKPDLPIVMLTGFVGGAEDPTAPEPRPERFALLEKPASPARLTERLASLMAAARDLETEAE